MQSAGRDQALHDADLFLPEFGPAEQPVFSADGNFTQGTLGGVVVDGDGAIVQIARQRVPVLQDIGDRACRG